MPRHQDHSFRRLQPDEIIEPGDTFLRAEGSAGGFYNGRLKRLWQQVPKEFVGVKASALPAFVFRRSTEWKGKFAGV